MPNDDRVLPIVVVMGVSGSGKTTVGAALAGLIGVDFVDGDDLHPKTNVDKMHAGHPLTDADRWPWLDRVGAALAEAAGANCGLVVACSALKRAYRDRIRAAAGPALLFVFLDVSRTEAQRRMRVRLDHFMPASLVDSQFEALEPPDGEADVLSVTALSNPSATARAVAERIANRHDLPLPAPMVRPDA